MVALESFDRWRRALDAWEQAGGGPTSSILGNGAIAALEARAAQRIGVTRGLALPSATLSLRVGLEAVGIGPRDEVIVPAYDWTAAAAATRSLGAVPVAADVTLPDCAISPEAVAETISTRTKAVVVTHLLGVPANVPAIQETCAPFDIPIIEDCSQALGARFNGQPAGSFGKAAVISFGPGKTLDGGEGGMLLTDDPALWRRAVELSQHPLRQLLAGIVKPNLAALGLRIHPMTAITVMSELEQIDARLNERHRLLEYVRTVIADVDGIQVLADFGCRSCVGPGLPVRIDNHRIFFCLEALGLRVRGPEQHLIADGPAIRRHPTPNADCVNRCVFLLLPIRNA